MIAALYVDPKGSYAGLPDVDLWDEARDARLYSGPYPVVAHPPCATWCQLASVNEARWGKTIGADGGCFDAALRAVRTYGGVLEHPAYSLAWKKFGLPRPTHGLWIRSLLDVGWVAQVSQSAYGHQARKTTWLYAVDCDLPELKPESPRGLMVVGAGVKSGQSAGRPRLQGKGSSATPESFRDVLISMARSVAPSSHALGNAL